MFYIFQIDALKGKHNLLDTVRILTSGLVGGKPIGWRNAYAAKPDPRRLEIESVLKRAKQRFEPYDTPHLNQIEDDRTAQAISRAFTEEEIHQGIKYPMTSSPIRLARSYFGNFVYIGLHLTGWHKFQDVFMISALNMDGIDLLQA